MNRLNVFNQNWCPWRYPSNWIKNARLFFRQFKWAYQRITKGYCDADWWDLDSHLTRLMADSIQDLADKGMGYPGTDEFPTPESWQKYLYRICYLLRYSLEELPNKYEDVWTANLEKKDFLKTINNPTPEEKEISKKYFDIEMKNEEKKRAAQQEALQMIAHVMGNLWD